MTSCPPITSVSVIGDHSVEVFFADGLCRRVDLEAFLRANASHEAISLYLDPARFAEVEIVDGDLAWGSDWDILLRAADLRAGEVAAEPVGDAVP